MKYQVVLHREPEGITVTVPGMPGCISEGDTEQEALENIRSAISEYLSAVREMTKEADIREVEIA